MQEAAYAARGATEKAIAAALPAQPILLGLIGSPIKSSAAPAMHEAAAAALGFRAHYHLIDVPGADRDTLRRMLDGVRLLGFAGVNVTFPYKEAVLPLLDALSPLADAIGTVNTVVVREGRLTGHNTDCTGFAAAFAATLGDPGDKPIALIGAGGVGRAIAFALGELGARALHIFDSDAAKANALSARLEARMAVRVCRSVAEALDGVVGVVNGTPVGMLPSRDNPVAEALLHDGLWVADAVYTPLWTPLLRAAVARGARVMTGRELCIHQAVDAFRLFTGRDAPAARIAETFDAVIARRNLPEDLPPAAAIRKS
jgi:shikimate dehydrogenase